MRELQEVSRPLVWVDLTAWSVLHFPHAHVPPYIWRDDTPFCASAAIIVARFLNVYNTLETPFLKELGPCHPRLGSCPRGFTLCQTPRSAAVSLISGVLISSSFSACRSNSETVANRYTPKVPPCHYFLFTKELPSCFLHLQAKLNALISLGSEVLYFQAKCKHRLIFHLNCFGQNHFLFFRFLPLPTCKVAQHHSCLRRSTVVSLIPATGCISDVETCLRSVSFCKVDNKKKKEETKFDLSESADKD